MAVKEKIALLAAELLSTASRISTARTTPDHKGMLITVVLANEAGTVTMTPYLQSKDAAGNWHTIWTAAAALAADGTTYFLIYPGTRVVEDYTEYVDIEIPETWRVGLTYAGTPATDKIDSLVMADLYV